MNLTVHLIGGAVRALPPWSCGYRRFRRASWASLYPCAVPVPAGVAVPCSLPEFEVLPVILPGLAAPIMPPGLSVRPQCAFARHVGQHRVLCRACGVACHFARACGARASALVVRQPDISAGSWASLYSCAVPVPVRGQYRVLCLGLWCCLPFCPGLRHPLCRPVVWQPDISAGSWASLYPCAVPVPVHRAVPVSLPGLMVLPVILSGLVGQHWVFSFGLCAHSAARSCGSRIFRRAVGHPCIPALCRFRQGWQYRVLCRRLRRTRCRLVVWHFSPVKVP